MKRSWLVSSYYTVIRLEVLNETTKYPSQDSRCPSNSHLKVHYLVKLKRILENVVMRVWVESNWLGTRYWFLLFNIVP